MSWRSGQRDSTEQARAIKWWRWPATFALAVLCYEVARHSHGWIWFMATFTLFGLGMQWVLWIIESESKFASIKFWRGPISIALAIFCYAVNKNRIPLISFMASVTLIRFVSWCQWEGETDWTFDVWMAFWGALVYGLLVAYS